jgi:hypothetical protein
MTSNLSFHCVDHFDREISQSNSGGYFTPWRSDWRAVTYGTIVTQVNVDVDPDFTTGQTRTLPCVTVRYCT